MTAKILTTLFIILVISSSIYIIKDFIKSIINHKRQMKKLDDWQLFHKQLMDWSKEINDSNVRNEYIQYCISLLLVKKTNIFDDSIEDTYKYIVKKYSNHIPSLLKELRNGKINDIIKD